VLACRVIDAIWGDDVAALHRLMQKHPHLLHEMASGTEKHNGGPPMTYPNVRASLRKKLHPGYGEDSLREYRHVTPLSWGERYDHKAFVSKPAMQLIAERGGCE
jgi:hypothetical protein